MLVLLGKGDGTFQPAVSTPSGANLTVVAAGDLNGDGKGDVVGVFNNSLMVYISKGDGCSLAMGMATSKASGMALFLAGLLLLSSGSRLVGTTPPPPRPVYYFCRTSVSV